MSAFMPDPSLPSILELAVMLWGQPTDWLDNGNEARFGTNHSKSVKLREMVWKDWEPPGGGGGYNDLYLKAIGPLPAGKPGKPWKPASNGAAAPNGHGGKVPPWQNIGKVYRYLDAAGHLVLEVIRTVTGTPRFNQRRPDPTSRSGWKWSLKDIPRDARPLYRLPELLNSGDATIYLCEGEKDADNLAALGLIATTALGGAGKWRGVYTGYFSGKPVVILPDNDQPGREHAEIVARALYGVASSVKVLALPGLPEKGDVSDWLAAGGDPSELEWLVMEAPLYAPPGTARPPGAPPGPGGGPGVGEVEGEVEAPSGDEGGGGGWPPEPPDDGPDVPPNEDPVEGDDLVTEQYAMRIFVTANQENLRFNHSSNSWLVWSDNFWRPDERRLAFSWALSLCRELAAAIQGRRAREGRLVVERVRFASAVEQGARTMPVIATAQGDWDADHMLLGTPGGVVDLSTGELRQGRREDMVSRQTAVTPSVMPDCPEFMKFLAFAMHREGAPGTYDPETMVRFMQRYFGYCLTGRISEEVFLFMFGQGGAGKGTLIETIVHILGDYASTAPMEIFTAGRVWSQGEYYRADMAGKRLIVANEPERGSHWAEAFIKETTGGDTLSGRHPMGRPFRFRPTHKLTLLGNHMPRLRGRSTGMERRLRILPFDNKPEKPDADLKTKLLKEAPGILRWLIEGCLAWQKIGLQPPDAVRIAGKDYFEGQDAFARWIEECCTLDEHLMTSPSMLRGNYNQWAKSNGEDEMGGNAFSEAIDQFTPPITNPPTAPLKRVKSDGNRLVRGIGINPSGNSTKQNFP